MSVVAAYFIINRVPSRHLKEPETQDEEEEDDEKLEKANDTETEREGSSRAAEMKEGKGKQGRYEQKLEINE